MAPDGHPAEENLHRGWRYPQAPLYASLDHHHCLRHPTPWRRKGLVSVTSARGSTRATGGVVRAAGIIDNRDLHPGCSSSGRWGSWVGCHKCGRCSGLVCSTFSVHGGCAPINWLNVVTLTLYIHSPGFKCLYIQRKVGTYITHFDTVRVGIQPCNRRLLFRCMCKHLLFHLFIPAHTSGIKARFQFSLLLAILLVLHSAKNICFPRLLSRGFTTCAYGVV